MPCVYLPGSAPAVSVANSTDTLPAFCSNDFTLPGLFHALLRPDLFSPPSVSIGGSFPAHRQYKVCMSDRRCQLPCAAPRQT